MKYDFSTYLTQALNENDEVKKKEPNITINKGSNKKVVISSNTTEKELVNFFKKYIDDIDIKEEGDKKVYVFNGEQGEYSFEDHSGLPFDKLYKKALEESKGDNDQKLLDEDGFKLLGKTIAYRSALTAWSIINNSGDDFKQAALDVFKDNSEYSIKQLENLDSLLDYSAADLTIKKKIKRNDKNDANYEKNLKTYKEYEEQLKSKENFNTIQTIKKNYEKEFKDTREVLEQAFNDGMAEQKKEMQSKDYKWKDPVTGKPPKGAEKLNQLGDKAYKMLESGVEKFSDFAKRQQGLDKAVLTLAVIGVKGMIFGAKVLKNLLTGAIKRTNMHDCLRNTAKFKDVENKIKIFMKEFEEWNKENSEQSKKDDKDKTDEEKKQEEDKKKTILMKLSELMNTHVMPYYYAKLAIITACIENKENKYIIKQEDNKWSTYNTSTGRLTVIEDNTILMYHLLKFLTDDRQIPGFRTGFNKVLETFGDEKPDFKLPTDVNFNPTYRTNLSNWLDRASTVKDIKNPHLPFRIGKFKENWEQFYTEELYKKSFANYKEFLEFCRKAQELLHNVHLPVAKGIRLKFKGDEDAGVPGVITGAKKETEEQENNGIDKEQINKDYKEISAALDELKNVNELNKVNDKFDTINSKINDTVDQLKGVVNKDTESDEAKKKKLEELLMAKTTIDKVIAIKAVMNNYNLTESVAMNEIIKLLNEDAEEGTEGTEANTPDIGSIKNEISEIIGGDITIDNASKFKEKSDKVYKEIEALYNKLNDDNKKKLEDYKDKPLQLLYSIGAIEGVKKEEPAPAPVDTNQTQDAINKTKQAIETAEDTDTIFNDEYFNELKGEFNKVYSTIDEMTKNNNELLQEFLNIKIDDDIKDELLPQLWHYKRFLTILFDKQKEAKKQEEGKKDIKDSYNPFYAHDMLVLLEAETEENKDNNNVVEALKAKTKAIKEILAQKDMEEFNKAYKVWKDEINKLLEKFDKIENKDKLTDPLQKLSAMGNYIKNKPEEKKEENPKPSEDGAKSEKSGETQNS